MLETDCELIERMGAPLQWLCDILQDQDTIIVAAAGNDGLNGDRPPARYPAALDGVLGVGALARGDIPAEYSNLSDKPIRAGVATFGGRANNGAAQPGESVLGVYTGPLPGATLGTTIPNTSGWAWWAGTSFAAPILSGSLAALLAGGATPTQALERVHSAQSTTSQDEIIFSVRQGP
jgi:subtilisin family serine protease